MTMMVTHCLLGSSAATWARPTVSNASLSQAETSRQSQRRLARTKKRPSLSEVIGTSMAPLSMKRRHGHESDGGCDVDADIGLHPQATGWCSNNTNTYSSFHCSFLQYLIYCNMILLLSLFCIFSSFPSTLSFIVASLLCFVNKVVSIIVQKKKSSWTLGLQPPAFSCRLTEEFPTQGVFWHWRFETWLGLAGTGSQW